ncbi:MAG: D-alanine--poly(phosphoribitol) ligase subunit DltC [Anaerovoracaceae bacterium]
MEEKILDLLEEICEDEVVRENLDISLSEEGLIDSLGYAELLIGLEDAFGIVLAPSEITKEEVDTPNLIIGLIKARI